MFGIRLLVVLLSVSADPTPTVIFVNFTSTSASPAGTQSNPYTDLTQALMEVSDEFLRIMLGGAEGGSIFPIATLGPHARVDLLCQENSIEGSNMLLVPPGMSVLFEDCKIRSVVESEEVAVVVMGVAVLKGCEISQMQTKVFVVYSSLTVSQSTFAFNADSIFVIPIFGVQLTVDLCIFQQNLSPVGTVLLFSASTSGLTSETSIEFADSTFIGNAAYMGGSIAMVNLKDELQPPVDLNTKTRQLTVKDCVFESNPGYLFLLYLKFFDVKMSGSLFRNTDYVVVCRLYSNAIEFSNLRVENAARFVVSTYFVGVISLRNVNITGVTEGPTIFLPNSALDGSGLLYISNLEISNFALVNTAYYSANILVLHSSAVVEHLYVHEGRSFGCACGCYFFAKASLTNITMTGVIANDGIFAAFLFAEGSSTHLRLNNSAALGKGLNACFRSNIHIEDVVMTPGEAGFALVKVPAVCFYLCFDSVITFRDILLHLPPIRNTAIFYLWNSRASVNTTTLPILYSNLADVYTNSYFHVENVLIGVAVMDTLITSSFLSEGYVANMTVEYGAILVSVFSALSLSKLYATDIHFLNLTLPAFTTSATSIVELDGVTISNMNSLTMFSRINKSEFRISNIFVTDSVFDFTQYVSGSAEFTNITLRRIGIKRRFISLTEATVVFDNLTIDGLEGTGVTPFCLVQKESQLTFHHTELRNFRSREQGMVHIVSSSLEFSLSLISTFNVTFISAQKSSITLKGTVIENGGRLLMDADTLTKTTAGFLDCVDCNIYLSNSVFRNISGTSGGVLLATSNHAGSLVEILYNDFIGCSALEDGGVAAVTATSLRVSNSLFRSCSARRGAGLYFDCKNESLCSANFSNLEFGFNTALEGGGFKWTYVRPFLSAITFYNNSVVYGPLEASIANHMVLANSSDSSMQGVAGVLIESPILIEFLDFINQTVTTDNSSYALLVSDSLIGTVYLNSISGLANFSAIIIRAAPASAIQIQVFSQTINSTGGVANYSFSYYNRACIPGEISSPQGCYPCPKNTFSVDPFEEDCRACPSYATCPGGSALELDGGYWRSSELSSTVLMCPINSACNGGQQSKCAEGYEGKLCSRCRSGFYMAGLTYCVACENLGVRIFRLCSFVVVFVAVVLVLINNSVSRTQSLRSVYTITTLKILLNFLQSILMISSITVDWRKVMMGFFSVNDMFVTAAVTSLTLECLPDLSLKVVYLKAIIASLCPIVLLLLNFFLYWLKSLIRHTAVSRSSLLQSSLILLYFLHPFIVKAGITLVTCKKIEGESIWLTAESSVVCWEGEHNLFVLSLFFPMTIILIIGIPCLFLLITRRLRRSSRDFAIRFFLNGFSPKRKYWELVVIGRKTFLIIALGLLGSAEAILQVLVAFMLPYMFLALHMKIYPYAQLIHNRLEAAALFILVLLGGFSFYFIAELRIHEQILLCLSLLLMIATVAYILTTVVILVRYRVGKKIDTDMTPSGLRVEDVQIEQISRDFSVPPSMNPPNSRINSSLSLMLNSAENQKV